MFDEEVGVMRVASLCFLVRENPEFEVLLGFKKRGFGCGRFNGFGGKALAGESIEQCVLRELEEEAGINVSTDDLHRIAVVDFGSFTTVHVFVANKWRGEPTESNEMIPIWFRLDEIPYDMMWETDRDWIPQIMGILRDLNAPHEVLLKSIGA